MERSFRPGRHDDQRCAKHELHDDDEEQDAAKWLFSGFMTQHALGDNRTGAAAQKGKPEQGGFGDAPLAFPCSLLVPPIDKEDQEVESKIGRER